MTEKQLFSPQLSDYIKFDFTSFRGKITLGFLSLFIISVFLALIPSFLMQKALAMQQEITSLNNGVNEQHNRIVALTNGIDAIESAVGLLSCFLIFALFGMFAILAYHLISTLLKRSGTILGSIDNLANGHLGEIKEGKEDEWKEIEKSIYKLSRQLGQVKNFAEEVGRGHFDSEVAVFNNQGSLGESLANMRKSLKEVSEGDKIRSWTSEGIAKFAHLLRQNDKSLEDLCYLLVSDLVKYLKASQGAIFILNDKQEEPLLEMKASYAYERRKYQNKSIRLGEGLAGQIFLEKESLLVTDVPQNYMTVTSGLGEALPKSILIVPLKLNEAVTGVLELASFQVFQSYDVTLVEKIAENIAATISSVRIAEETQRLLQESLASTEQLKSQEEELRQNLEELQTTQDQMQRQTRELQKMQESLVLEKSMFQVLMEYSPDRLTYKDTECRLLRVNMAKAKRFKMSPEEMIGKTDYDFFPAEHAAKAMKEEKELMQRGEPMLDILEKVGFDNGDVMFINTSRIPFRNEMNEMIGTFIISKDITHLKLMEGKAESQEKLLQGVLETMSAFRYKIDSSGILKEIHLGALLPAMANIEGRSIQEMWPSLYAQLPDANSEEGISVEALVQLEEGNRPFRHYLLPDAVYANVYIGFAVQQIK